MLALGLMSGTSLDGVDIALVDTDGETVASFGPAATVPYSAEQRLALMEILGGKGAVEQVERDFTLFHAQVVRDFLAEHGIDAAKVGVAGFHGHTILHAPAERRTWQIGDGALLASEIGIAVVNDFRSADVAAGGQGAPLVPVYHRALAARLEGPLAILNLGGVGNVTWISEDGSLLAFDTGPGNALLDDWAMAHTGRPVDVDGALSAAGRVRRDAVEAFLHHTYFDRQPPKSVDRDEFHALAWELVKGCSAEDGAATLTAFTAASVALAAYSFPRPVKRWLVTGGGRRNPEMMSALSRGLSAPVEPVEAVGWNGDALEAQAFAFLAVRSLAGLMLTYPETTGVSSPQTGGRRHVP
ncbi:Anhydro-N-acetylmuramic acid kinase [Paramagnetospirillum magnetotacticum MS-1]|uniref:Anhydro-N-acetylmuramic acid kinase n=1 Tax=Paramagnetospirillum magnetotacticum MS-1 TaxID=272627 RepID=A0A0C2YYI1_PARME|nr:anhydro-N-acetylmuramic acid kinase [Paramagnetospirillum magnetotacticum]KIM00129.1 Anhydro-N-acetylmuramic acid kinase [Paramagnetospirillum magnetotacticum MS-1]